MEQACSLFRRNWRVDPLTTSSIRPRKGVHQAFTCRNEVRCFGLFLSWTFHIRLQFKLILLEKMLLLQPSMAACLALILSLSTPPPVLGRFPQRRCALLPLIVWGFVCKGSNIDCPYFEGAAARSRKTSADQRKSGKVVRWGR